MKKNSTLNVKSCSSAKCEKYVTLNVKTFDQLDDQPAFDVINNVVLIL